MKKILILSLLLLQIFGQIQLQNDVISSGQVSPGNPINFNYQIETTTNGIIVEIAGTSNDSNPVAINYGNRVLRQLSGITSLTSTSADFTGTHSTGFVCPNDVVSGNSDLTLSTFSSSTSDYMLRLIEYNPRLNDGLVIQDELCCPFVENQGGKIYTYLISNSANQINIFVRRESQRTFLGDDLTRLIINYNDCSTSDSTSNYTFSLISNTDNLLTIDLSSNPPIQPGSMIFLTFLRSTVGSPQDGLDLISVGICEGNGCTVDFPVSNDADCFQHFYSFSLICSVLSILFF
jgi:hypothetical protein